jgi:hypothetical protein
MVRNLNPRNVQYPDPRPGSWGEQSFSEQFVPTVDVRRVLDNPHQVERFCCFVLPMEPATKFQRILATKGAAGTAHDQTHGGTIVMSAHNFRQGDFVLRDV